MINPGAQSVLIRTFTAGGRDRLNAEIKVTVDTPVAYCAMQPLATSEFISDVDVETELWRCIAPATVATLGIDTNAQVVYQNRIYEVIGVKPYTDFMGTLDHVTLDLKRQQG